MIDWNAVMKHRMIGNYETDQDLIDEMMELMSKPLDSEED